MKRLILIFFLLILYTTSTGLFGQETLRPVAKKYNQSLNSFVKQLEVIIDEKDFNGLLRLLDKNVVNGFEYSSGVQKFKSIWENDDKIWIALERIVQLGAGRIDQFKYEFPYVHTNWPDAYDLSDHGVITGRRVNIREEPTTKSNKSGQMTNQIVRVYFDLSKTSLAPNSNLTENPLKEIDWYYIESIDGTMCGYVYWKYFWNPEFYRLIVEEFNGIWRITAFMAGG